MPRHAEKAEGVVRPKLAYVTEVNQRMRGDAEAYCIVPGDLASVSFTASPARCKMLTESIGEEVRLGVVGDHVCSVEKAR